MIRWRRDGAAAAQATVHRALVEPALDGGFGDHDLDGLPEPAQRHLRAVITAGAPVARTVSLRMRGRIRIGRWMPFRATEVLSPHRGFVWSARVAGVVAGWDRYVDGAGAMRWKLAGLATVAAGDGPDVSRSAAGRAAAEAMWVPTALLPRCGVAWSSTGPDEASLHYDLGGPVNVSYRLDTAGLITSFAFDRWGDPDETGAWGWQRFGGEITGHRRFGDALIPASGRVGWHYGTERWPEGAFFEFVITEARPLGTI